MYGLWVFMEMLVCLYNVANNNVTIRIEHLRLNNKFKSVTKLVALACLSLLTNRVN